MEQRKFKVGDQVRIKSGWEKDKVGKIVNIGMIHAFPYLVLFNEKINMLGNIQDLRTDVMKAGYDPDKCYFYSESELVEEKEMMGDDNMKQRKFKVGDKVKVNSRESFKPCVGIGEIIHIDDEAMPVPYLVGVKGFDGHSGNALGAENIAKQKGYDMQCWWCGESGLELLEEKKMTRNKLINALMEELGVEVGEEFEISGWENSSPYYFNEDGELLDSCDVDSDSELSNLIYKKSTIKKIKKPEAKKMTIAEIEKELGYEIEVVKEEK